MNRPAELGLLLLVLASGLVTRVPGLHNSVHGFNSDEAVNALVVKHMLERGRLVFHNWDATYYGTVEGLLAVPFVLVLGLVPLAFKLGATVGFVLLVVATWALGRRLFGPAAGLTAAAVVAVFSQSVVRWSTNASAGFALIVALGTFTLWLFAEARERPAGWKTVLLGALIGFGLYVYELYVVWIVVLAAALVTDSFPWRALHARTRADLRQALGLAPRQLGALGLLALGVVVGGAPRFALALFGEAGSKTPGYAFASSAAMVENLRLLVMESIPAILGTQAVPERVAANPVIAVAGGALLAAWAVIMAWAAREFGRPLLGVFGRPPARLDAPALLVLLVPVPALLFVLSTNAVNVLSSRYLLPCLSALPIFAGVFVVRLWRRSPPAATLLFLLLVGVPLVQLVRWYHVVGYLGPGLSLVRVDDPVERLLDRLRAQGVSGGYGQYWTTYKAIFQSGERIVFGQFADWQRNPAYTRYADTLPSPVYVFRIPGEREGHEQFLELLRSAGSRYVTWNEGPYRVYASPDGRRLLPPVGPMARPLDRFAADVAAEIPASVPAGERLRVPVSVTNRGSLPWSALGREGGSYRVSVGYRWLDPAGWRLPDGARTPLPGSVAPGESARLTADVVTPGWPGRFQLVVTLVQGGTWFDAAGGGAAVAEVLVEAGTARP